MTDTSKHIESFLKDSIPHVLLLTEDQHKNQLFNSLRQSSIDASGSNSPRLQFISLSDIPDFSGLTIDYIGPKLILGDIFLTYPSSIIIYIDISSIDHYEKDDYLINIENSLSYFAKDLGPFIINQTKIILLLNLDTNAPNSNVITTAIKNFNICTLDHIFCFYNEELDKNIKKTEELCYSYNTLFCERHIRHLKKVELIDSVFYKNNPEINDTECNKWESLKYAYIAYIYELIKDNKNSLKNYDFAWSVVKNNQEKQESDIELVNDLFIISDDYYDILVTKVIRFIILVKSTMDKHNIGSQLRDIVRNYYKLITNNQYDPENPIHLYKLARLHYFTSENLSNLEDVYGLKQEFFKFKPYHLLTAGRFTFILQKLIKSNNVNNELSISCEDGIKALEAALIEFSNLGWNAHVYITQIMLFKFHMLQGNTLSALTTFNKIYQNSLFEHHTHANCNQIDINTSENICANCTWKNEWSINDDMLSHGKMIISNKIGWICTSLRAINGDSEAMNKIIQGVNSGTIMEYLPLQLNAPGRATLYVSSEIILLEFKLQISSGFYSSSGELKYQVDDDLLTCNFTFERMSNGDFLIGLVQILNANSNSKFEIDPMELESREYNLILTPFDGLDHSNLSKCTSVYFNVGIENLALFKLSVPLLVNDFIPNPKLIKNLGWPRNSLKYELPYSKRQNSVIRSSVNVIQLTDFWVDKHAPIIIEFDVYNCTISHQEIKITIENCNLNQIKFEVIESAPITHFKYHLDVFYNDLKNYNLQIQTPYDNYITSIELNYIDAIEFIYKLDTITSDSIGVSDFKIYSAKITNLLKNPINVIEIYDSQTSITSEQFGLSQDLACGESFLVLLNDYIQVDKMPREIKLKFKIRCHDTTDQEWIATSRLDDVEIEYQDVEINCSSDKIANIDTEFNYQALIKNNSGNTLELQLKLINSVELLVSGPLIQNIILLPYDSKILYWKIISTIPGYIKLPSIIIGKKRWIRTGDEHPLESASTYISILPNIA